MLAAVVIRRGFSGFRCSRPKWPLRYGSRKPTPAGAQSGAPLTHRSAFPSGLSSWGVVVSGYSFKIRFEFFDNIAVRTAGFTAMASIDCRVS